MEGTSVLVPQTPSDKEIHMQLFGNVATEPVRKESKTTGKGYFEMRVAESQRGIDTSPTFYTVRVMKDVELGLKKGDFVKVTGKLKVDFYIGRDGKPTGTLLVIAFEAAKIAKPEVSKPAIQAAERPKAQPLTQPLEERTEVRLTEATWDALI